MPVQLQVQLFDAFLGEQEGIHSIILPDVYSSGGSQNLWIDKYGRAKKVDGYSKQNSSAITTDTGTSATLVRALLPYRATAGGSTTRQLLAVFDDGSDEWEIWKSTDDGATWTFVSDKGSGSVGKQADSAQFNDNLIITNGVVAPLKWDGSSLTTAGRTQSPTITSSAGSVGNLGGVYKWKLVSMVGGSRQAASVASTALSLQSKQGSLSWTADANTNVTGYELYRTTGTGEIYYYVTFIDGRTTVSYTDNTSDLTILESRVLEEHGDAPPTTYYVEPHKQRLWYARTTANPTRAYWSDAGLPEDVLSTNFLDFSDSDTVGDVITGMIGNYEGRLIVFTEKALWTVSGTGSVIGDIADWTRIRSNAQIGCVSHRAAVRVPAGAKYPDQNGEQQTTPVVTVAYLTPLGDIRIFDGDNDIVISNPEKRTLAGINYASRASSFAITDLSRSEITWLFPSGSSGEPDTAITWNYRWGVWYKRDWAFSSGVETDNSSTSSLLLAGSNSTTTGGYVFKLWDGNSNNGAAIEAVWMSKALFGINDQGQPSSENLKRWRWADFLFETEQGATITIEWLSGNAPDNGAAIGSTTISPAAQYLVTADGDQILTADGDSILVAQLSTEAIALLQDSSGVFLHDQGIRLRIGDNASAGSWSLESFKLAYQTMPGLKRRMP